MMKSALNTWSVERHGKAPHLQRRGFSEAVRCELLHDRVDIHIGIVRLPGLNTPQFEWCPSKMEYRPQPVPPIL